MAALIVSQRAEHGVPHAVSCRALGVSQAWFYKWRNGDCSLRRKHRTALAAQIDYLFAKHNGTYGSPRITADLRELGYRVSVNTVAEVMAEKGLVARQKRKRRSTTRPDRSARKAPDAVNRDFTPRQRPDVTWCGDLTDIPTDEGAFYLAGILDLHSRRCVGFAMGAHHDAELARAALCVAIAVRGGTVAGVAFHSDYAGVRVKPRNRGIACGERVLPRVPRLNVMLLEAVERLQLVVGERRGWWIVDRWGGGVDGL